MAMIEDYTLNHVLEAAYMAMGMRPPNISIRTTSVLLIYWTCYLVRAYDLDIWGSGI